MKRNQVFRENRRFTLTTMLVLIGCLPPSARSQHMTRPSPLTIIPVPTTSLPLTPAQMGITQELAQPAPSPLIVMTRLTEIVRHQNEIRKERGLPALSAKAPSIGRYFAHPNLLGVRTKRDSNSKTEAVTFFSAGDVVFKGDWGDTKSTNFAYLFDGSTLKKTQPFAEFALERFAPNNEVYLVRNMGTVESEHWLKKEIETLKGNRRYWGYERGVAHFELGGRSWIGSHRAVAAAWKVPKDILLHWLHAGELAMGITSISRTANSASPNIEVVVSENAWRELANYRVQDDTTKVSPWKKALSWLLGAVVSRQSRTRAKH